jgi:hypothetical protein
MFAHRGWDVGTAPNKQEISTVDNQPSKGGAPRPQSPSIPAGNQAGPNGVYPPNGRPAADRPRIFAHPTIEDRPPPCNLEAERSCLGSILLDASLLPAVADCVAVADFYRDAHQLIFAAMLELHARGGPVDPVSLADELGRRDQFAKVGGDEAIREIVESVPHAVNGPYYAAIVREKSAGRALIDAATGLIRDAYSGRYTAQELHGRASAVLERIDLSGTAGGDQRLKDYRPRTFGQVVDRIGGLEHLWPGWLILGNLSMVYSKPKVGKTRVYLRIVKTLWSGEPWPDGVENRWPAGSKTLIIPYDRNHQEIHAEMARLGIPDAAALCPSDPGDADGIGLLSLTDPLMLLVLEKTLADDDAIRLIVVDTLTYASEKSLSKPEDMKAILDDVMVLAARHRVAVWLLIHENKEGKALGRRVDERARVIMKVERYSEADPGKLRFWVADSNAGDRPALTATHTDNGIVFSRDEGPTGIQADRRDACAAWLVAFLRGRPGLEADYGSLIDAAGRAGFAGSYAEAENRWSNRNLLDRAIKGLNEKAESLAEFHGYAIGRREEPRPGCPKPRVFYRLEEATADIEPLPEPPDPVPF